ncbi:hypothetical protein NL676_015232 [Syzygium grande]|nr:hypothetical protein NL676_015232 [Syzygium grande]
MKLGLSIQSFDFPLSLTFQRPPIPYSFFPLPTKPLDIPPRNNAHDRLSRAAPQEPRRAVASSASKAPRRRTRGGPQSSAHPSGTPRGGPTGPTVGLSHRGSRGGQQAASSRSKKHRIRHHRVPRSVDHCDPRVKRKGAGEGESILLWPPPFRGKKRGFLALLEARRGRPFRSYTQSVSSWEVKAFAEFFPTSVLRFHLGAGSIAINFGTNLLKLGHNERERQSLQDMDGANGKLPLKPIIHFHTWRVGILFFFLGNCLNFISFGYAAQSLLAALGSIQFVSNIAFAYFVLNKMVTVKYSLGNIFLVAFGNHQSPVYTPEQLAEKYSNITFLFYCVILVLIVALHHAVYRRGELLIAVAGQELRPYWHMLLPFSYAIVSGAVGSCSVLFAKSLSNLLRLAMSSSYQLHSWFTYSMLLLFLSTAGFWMTRLNEGLSLFDAILIVPMFQIAWTFFSICTGFVYFQEYQVFDALRTTMFILGMTSVFVGISLLAPDESRGGEVKDNPSLSSVTSSGISSEADRLIVSSGDGHSKEMRSFVQEMTLRITDILVRAKNACSVSLGFTDDSINASAVLVMPMVSSKITGFRSTGFDRSKVLSMKNFGWSRISLDEEGAKMMDTAVVLQ